jgi:hypothetical protein
MPNNNIAIILVRCKDIAVTSQPHRRFIVIYCSIVAATLQPGMMSRTDL